MTEHPVVSVVLPCYNHEKYIGQAIESVLNQTYKNIELIVADNGSTDGSYEVICGYSDRIARIVQLKENSILFCSEILVMAATGEYIAFMTSDDYWEPDKLELQIQALHEHPEAAVSATWTVYVDDELRPFGDSVTHGPFKTEIFRVENKSRYEWFRNLIYNGNCLAWPSAVFRTETYKEILYRWRGHRQLSDYYTWLCTVQRYDIYVVPKVLVKYRWHPSGANRNESALSNASMVRHVNEMTDVLYNTIEDVDDDFFLEAFKSDLCSKDITLHEEVLCEKFFLLKRLADKHTAISACAMSFFCNHFMEMRNAIHEKYHFSYADYHDWAGERGIGALFYKVSGTTERDGKRLWRMRDALLNNVHTEAEYSEAIKVLFAALEPEKQELIKTLGDYIEKALNLMKEFQKTFAPETYQGGILLIDGITKIVDSEQKDLEFLCVDLKEEDWRAYKGIIDYAKNEVIDLDEALIPYTEYLEGQLQRIVI